MFKSVINGLKTVQKVFKSVQNQRLEDFKSVILKFKRFEFVILKNKRFK